MHNETSYREFSNEVDCKKVMVVLKVDTMNSKY